MITREADYALRVILCLAELPKGKTLSTAALAERMFIPYRFLRRIVRRLCATGIVGSVRGKDGGIHLLKKAANISVHDILTVFDPRSLMLNRCYEEENSCPRKGKCAVHLTLAPVQKLLNDKLKSISFSEMTGK
ncbi:MAG: Rrf2 family transcriptional regulator [Victivallales bacterium]|jgi:Rrf2 family protein